MMRICRRSLCAGLIVAWVAAAPHAFAEPGSAEVQAEAPPAPALAPEPAAPAAPAWKWKGKEAGAEPLPPAPPPTNGWQWRNGAAAPAGVPAEPGTSGYHQALLAESYRLRLDIEDLREQRSQYGIGGPITMMALGGTIALGALSNYSNGDCYNGDCSSDDNTALVFALGGAGLAVFGLVLLNNRMAPRRELATEIAKKQRQLRSVQYQLHMGVSVVPTRNGLALALTY